MVIAESDAHSADLLASFRGLGVPTQELRMDARGDGEQAHRSSEQGPRHGTGLGADAEFEPESLIVARATEKHCGGGPGGLGQAVSPLALGGWPQGDIEAFPEAPMPQRECWACARSRRLSGPGCRIARRHTGT